MRPHRRRCRGREQTGPEWWSSRRSVAVTLAIDVVAGRTYTTGTLSCLDWVEAFDRMNHHGLFVRLMQRRIPIKLLCVLEQCFYWLYLCKVGFIRYLFLCLETRCQTGRRFIAQSICCLRWQCVLVCQWLRSRLFNQAVLHEHFNVWGRYN